MRFNVNAIKQIYSMVLAISQLRQNLMSYGKLPNIQERPVYNSNPPLAPYTSEFQKESPGYFWSPIGSL